MSKPRNRFRPSEWQDLFWQLVHAGWSIADIAAGYGISEAETREALDEELLADHEWLVSREREVTA